MEHIQTVCFTGHRHIPECDRLELTQHLAAEIERQIQAGATVFRTGGAIGFDTLAAQAVLAARRRHPQVCLELILPCPSQTDKWNAEDTARYRSVLKQADRHRYVSSFYFSGLLQMRNRALVEGADVCIAYLNRSHGGGTAYTSALAIRSGLTYINLAERVGWETAT